MKIYLYELSDEPKDLTYSEADTWVTDILSQLDEKTEESNLKPIKTQHKVSRPIQVHFSLHKVDQVVIVSGKVETELQLLCSRCVSPYWHPGHCRFDALFTRDPAMAGISRDGHERGHARHAHDEDDEKNLDITFLTKEFIDLSEVLLEQLRLQIPFQPLCSTECKGICMHCGADLNRGRCACDKMVGLRPFSALKDYRPKADSK